MTVTLVATARGEPNQTETLDGVVTIAVDDGAVVLRDRSGKSFKCSGPIETIRVSGPERRHIRIHQEW